jgi:hypothetical protein
MTISRAYALEHFDEICERAENGEEIVLERPGKTGLALVPRADKPKGGSTPEAVKAMLEFMDSQPKYPGRIDYRALINEGRRC